MRKLELWTINRIHRRIFFCIQPQVFVKLLIKSPGAVKEHNDQNYFSQTANSVLALCFRHLQPHIELGYKTFLDLLKNKWLKPLVFFLIVISV